ncbi:hypothetical protein WMY93_021804 [Mugilogobius chulae]|uniref:Uncharacterized protein n=1 Tax=Mugilogobius chulae TaxID=88201 RepID=A0AAW0NLS4_9GOBI
MLRRRMGYADPSSGKDLLGNRSLCFIFICAFGLVTLLQQILYGKNYIKSAQQFSRLKGDEAGNWTGPVNFSDDGSLKPARNGRKRCFRQNFQPDSQISVIVTPCLADIKKKKNALPEAAFVLASPLCPIQHHLQMPCSQPVFHMFRTACVYAMYIMWTRLSAYPTYPSHICIVSLCDPDKLLIHFQTEETGSPQQISERCQH